MKIIETLKPNKGYLQSCALLMNDGAEKEAVIHLLIKSGITRITSSTPSAILEGEAYDRLFPLKEYFRAVDIYRQITKWLRITKPFLHLKFYISFNVIVNLHPP